MTYHLCFRQVGKEVDLIDFDEYQDDQHDSGRGGGGSSGGSSGGSGSIGGSIGGPFLYRTLPQGFDKHGVLPCTASIGEQD